jgi:NAD dependent epimerase/dehydratase family
MKDSRQRLLVTGAAGYIAGLIMPALREHYQLRRLDVVGQRPVGDDEVVQADVCDVGLVTEACQDVAGVVHLAAKAFEDDFLSVLLPRNVIGTWSVFQAAARAGVTRVIFASTGQTVGANPPGAWVTPQLPPRPISVYACTKLFGEALGRYHRDHHAYAWPACASAGLSQPTARSFRPRPPCHRSGAEPRISPGLCSPHSSLKWTSPPSSRSRRQPPSASTFPTPTDGSPGSSQPTPASRRADEPHQYDKVRRIRPDSRNSAGLPCPVCPIVSADESGSAHACAFAMGLAPTAANEDVWSPFTGWLPAVAALEGSAEVPGSLQKMSCVTGREPVGCQTLRRPSPGDRRWWQRCGLARSRTNAAMSDPTLRD